MASRHEAAAWPYVYSLAPGGEQGVRDALDSLVAELDCTLALTGCPSLADLTLDSLVRVASDRLTPNG